MEITLFGKLIDFKELQPENAESLIKETESGILTDFKEVHPENAEGPIEVTDFEISTETKSNIFC